MSEGRNNVLEGNRLARDGLATVRHAPFAEHTLRIPYRDYMALTRIFPNLLAKDLDTKEAALAELHASPLVDAYRVRTRKAQLGHF